MYYRRLKIFLGLVGVVVVVWAARLAVLQLLLGDDYLRQARENLINPPQVSTAERGWIVDRYGVWLARDEKVDAVAVEYGVLSNNAQYLASGTYRRTMSRSAAERLAGPARQRYDRLLAEVAELCGVTGEELSQRCRRIVEQVTTVKEAVGRRAGRPTLIPAETIAHVVISDISPDTRDKLGRLLAGEGGVRLTLTRRRSYPLRECLAHVVGTEGAVSAEDLAADPFTDEERRRYLPGESRGLTGAERSAESVLRGWRGVTQTDRDGKVLQDIQPVRGGTVRLTIDADLQKYIYKLLGWHVARSRYPCGGAVVVINLGDRMVRGEPIRDGDILALVSYPSFDPNVWRPMYDELRSDDRGQPMLARAVAAIYPPGSIVKPAVLAAALRTGTLKLNETLECLGYLTAPDKPFKCWSWSTSRSGHGALGPSDALKYSCNVFFYKIGRRMALPLLTEWLERFALARRLDIGLAEERAGVVPSPLWLAANRADYAGYSPADACNVVIGQGDLCVTPLAGANLMAALARGGVLVQPRLVIDAAARAAPENLGIDWAYMKVVQDGLRRVVNEPRGTAHEWAFMDNVVLAGKTGSATCSRRLIGGELYPPASDWTVKMVDGQPKDVWGPLRPAHAWFAGYAPADKPTVAIACLIEYGMSGGKAAGPLARKVVQLCVNLDYVEPSHPGEKAREIEGLDEPVVPPAGGRP